MYKFKRIVDRFGPGDEVPEDKYSAEQIAQMVANKLVEEIKPEPEPKPKPKRTTRKK